MLTKRYIKMAPKTPKQSDVHSEKRNTGGINNVLNY